MPFAHCAPACAASVLVLLGLTVVPTRDLQAVEEVNASHILVRTAEEAEAIRKEVVEKGGEKKAFTEAARKHSKDPVSKILGGNLGWFPRRGSMEQPFADAAFTLKVGEISAPVKTSSGWHIIYLDGYREEHPDVAEQRERVRQTKDRDAGTRVDPVHHDHDGHDHSGHDHSGHDHGAHQHTEVPRTDRLLPDRPAPAAAPGQRRTLSDRTRLVLAIESVNAGNQPERLNNFEPTQAVELNLSLKNESRKELKVPVAALLPLGFRVIRTNSGAEIQPDFASLPEPAAYFTTLRTYEITGIEVSISEYFRTLGAGRFDVSWDSGLFFRRLEERFPKAREAADYAAVKADLTAAGAVTVDKIARDASPHLRFKRSRPYTFSIFERPSPTANYYAQIKLRGEPAPVVIELDTKNQLQGAQQFMRLALDGFYDMLDFYEVREGDYLIGGSPTRSATGAPPAMLPRVRNSAALPHERGTVSFVSRSIRREGPVQGGEIGSIFFICLKPHPEWNDEHVPFGKVVSGLEILDRIKVGGPMSTFESVAILSEEEYKYQDITLAGDEGKVTTGNPEALIKTAKGNLTVSFFEDAAPNTVGSFITLAEDGFFDKTLAGTGKQTFFSLLRDAKGDKLLIQAGSPTNDHDGGPGYRLRDETLNNPNKCVRGALVMSKQVDESGQSYIPDSAGSQFFICLQDIPYYDHQAALTVFGLVTSGFDVLAKLEEGDAIESVQVTKKRRHPYGNFRKIQP
jgi:cyclophilin family peptidyl-prolyl cis-trans isomerase